ncbi:hypothetical protein ACVWWO_000548 [Bradyrhizobium sp. F1.13.1]
MASARRPSIAMTPALQRSILRSSALASACSRIATRRSPSTIEAAIAGGIGGAEAERRNRRAFGQRRAQPRKGLGRDQRRVAERNQQIIHAPRNGIARRQHRMCGAEPFMLHEGERVGADALCFVRHRLMVGSDHDRERGAGSPGRRGEHVGEQALVRDRMQHFRQV